MFLRKVLQLHAAKYFVCALHMTPFIRTPLTDCFCKLIETNCMWIYIYIYIYNKYIYITNIYLINIYIYNKDILIILYIYIYIYIYMYVCIYTYTLYIIYIIVFCYKQITFAQTLIKTKYGWCVIVLLCCLTASYFFSLFQCFQCNRIYWVRNIFECTSFSYPAAC